MAKTQGTLAWVATVAPLLFAAAGSAFGQDLPRTVAVHLDDYARVPAADLLDAQREVTRIYAAAGVDTEWVELGAPRDDGRMHITVVILDARQVAMKVAAERLPAGVLGQAAHGAHRAYILHQRVRETAASYTRHLGILLGTVIAHEIGHLLLPERGHSMVGLMRADVELRSRLPPEFTPRQSAAIRGVLTGHAMN